jgi:PAS domain S-box-containing protein
MMGDIRSKAKIIFFTVFLAIFAVLFIFSRSILLANFARLDEERIHANVQRAISALDNELTQMRTVNRDWASWDDTYEFVVSPDENYIRVNLTDETFQNLRLNLMLFVDTAGEIVYSKAYDLDNGTEVPVPSSFKQRPNADDKLWFQNKEPEELTGVLVLPEGPMLLVANSILTSEDKGPPRGLLIWGRYLDQQVIHSLAERTLLPLEITNFSHAWLASLPPEAQQQLLQRQIYTRPISDKLLYGYAVIRDIYGEPALTIKVEMPRSIYQQGLATVRYFLISLVVVCLLFALLAYLLIDRTILSRVVRLSTTVSALGKKKDFSARLALPGNDEVSRLAAAIDSTFAELAQSYQALAESEQKYSALVENSNDGIVVVQDGLIKFANRKAVEMGGFSMEETMGKPFVTFVCPEYQQMVIDSYQRTTAGERLANSYEVEVTRKDGKRITVEVNASRIRFEGRPADMAIIRDITERKRTQEQLVLAQRLATIGELATSIARELNGPLRSIVALSDLLQNKEDVPEEIKQDLTAISNEAQHIAGTVRNLLTLGQKHALQKQPCQLNDIIEEVLKLRAYEHKMSNIAVIKRLAHDLPEVMADYFQMKQVFLSIVMNAEYFMVRAHNRGNLIVVTEKADNAVKISFIDDGPGIARENLSRIFDPFFTTKPASEGTGLGLSISQAIIAEHGGRIYAQSDPGNGATFVIELPLDQA